MRKLAIGYWPLAFRRWLRHLQGREWHGEGGRSELRCFGMKRLLVVVVMSLVVVGCSDEASEPTTSTAPEAATTTTAAAAAPTTTTTAGDTTSTSFLPISEPNPELQALAGIWTSETTNSWSIKLDGFTVVGGGNPTNLVISGSVDVEDGVLEVRGLDLGPGGCGEAVGRYTVTRDGNSLTIDLIDDACERRSEAMPGQYALVE